MLSLIGLAAKVPLIGVYLKFANKKGVTGIFTKVKMIMRKSTKQFTSKFVMYTQNWICVSRGKKGTLSFVPKVLGVVMNQYIAMLS